MIAIFILAVVVSTASTTAAVIFGILYQRARHQREAEQEARRTERHDHAERIAALERFVHTFGGRLGSVQEVLDFTLRQLDNVRSEFEDEGDRPNGDPKPARRKRHLTLLGGGKAIAGVVAGTAAWKWISDHPRPVVGAASAAVIAAVVWGALTILGPGGGGRLAEPPGPYTSLPPGASTPPELTASATAPATDPTATRTLEGTASPLTATRTGVPPSPGPTEPPSPRPTEPTATQRPTPEPSPTRTRTPRPTPTVPTRTPTPTPTTPEPTPMVACLVDIDIELLPPALRAQLRALCRTIEDATTYASTAVR